MAWYGWHQSTGYTHPQSTGYTHPQLPPAVPQEITVTGGCNQTVASLINGTYLPQGTNHGKPVYIKNANVLMYFWDMRDGETYCGWWFGPKVGGNQVWAHNKDRGGSLAPPTGGWKVPWDGDVDVTLKLTHNIRKPVQSWEDPSQRLTDEESEKQQFLKLQKRDEDNRYYEENKKEHQAQKEEMEKKAMELRTQREEESVRCAEQAAALLVRRVIQRVRIATPENFDGLVAELEKVHVAQLDKLGPHAEKVQQEAERALLQARERVSEMAEKQVAEEQRLREEETQRKVEAARLERLAAEAAKEVTEVERLTACASKVAKPLFRASSEETPEPEAELEVVRMTEVALEAAQAVLVAATKSLEENKETEISSTELRTFRGRLATCRSTLGQLRGITSSAQDEASQRAAVLKKEQEQTEQFMRHDLDGDGSLNREEVISFAVAECQFEPDDDLLNKIFSTLAGGNGADGIPRDKAQRLCSMIAIAQSEEKLRAKRVAYEEERAEKASLIKDVLNSASEIFKDVDLLVSEAEGLGVAPSANHGERRPEHVKKIANLVQEKLDEGFATLEKGSKKLDEATGIAGSTEGLSASQKDIMKHRSRVSRLKLQLDKIGANNRIALERFVEKERAAIEELCTKIMLGIHKFMDTEDKSGEQLFAELSCKSTDAVDDSVDVNSFVTFVRSLPGLEDASADKLFHYMVGDGSLGRKEFLDIIRLFYRVMKPTVLQQEPSVQSSTLRRLEVGEIVEVLEGPKEESDARLMRVRVLAVRDSVDGWVTLSSNQGTVFLEPGGSFYSCVKETNILDGPPGEESGALRRLSRGEVVKVLEFERSPFSNALHIKCKANLDGVKGWVMVKGSSGITFMEPT